MREIVCRPRSATKIRLTWQAKEQDTLDSLSSVKAAVRSMLSTDSACARMASRIEPATCSEVASFEFSSESTRRSAEPTKSGQLDRTFSFRQAVVYH